MKMTLCLPASFMDVQTEALQWKSQNSLLIWFGLCDNSCHRFMKLLKTVFVVRLRPGETVSASALPKAICTRSYLCSICLGQNVFINPIRILCITSSLQTFFWQQKETSENNSALRLLSHLWRRTTLLLFIKPFMVVSWKSFCESASLLNSWRRWDSWFQLNPSAVRVAVMSSTWENERYFEVFTMNFNSGSTFDKNTHNDENNKHWKCIRCCSLPNSSEVYIILTRIAESIQLSYTTSPLPFSPVL